MTEDEKVGEIIKKFVGLGPKMNSSLKGKVKNNKWLTEQKNES